MSGERISIGSETLTDFLRREGRVTTLTVAGRFGWSLERARKELRLVDGVQSEMERPYRYCAMYAWWLP